MPYFTGNPIEANYSLDATTMQVPWYTTTQQQPAYGGVRYVRGGRAPSDPPSASHRLAFVACTAMQLWSISALLILRVDCACRPSRDIRLILTPAAPLLLAYRSLAPFPTWWTDSSYSSIHTNITSFPFGNCDNDLGHSPLRLGYTAINGNADGSVTYCWYVGMSQNTQCSTRLDRTCCKQDLQMIYFEISE